VGPQDADKNARIHVVAAHEAGDKKEGGPGTSLGRIVLLDTFERVVDASLLVDNDRAR
jgi:hypothetical protein